MKTNQLAGLAAVAVLLTMFALLLVQLFPVRSSRVVSFEECAKAGYPVMESYPRQCMTAHGDVFVEEDINELLADASMDATPHCVVAGCNGEICTEELQAPFVATACMAHPAFSCYQVYGTCERQVTGQCGWTDSAALDQCVETPEMQEEAEAALSLEVI